MKKLVRFVSVLGMVCGASGCTAQAVDTTEESEPAGEVEQGIYNGTAVNGAGSDQRWEGIVNLSVPGGTCTAFFITDRHLLTAAHCTQTSGNFSIAYSAPTLARVSQTADVTVNPCWVPFGGGISCDQAIITLRSPERWATPARRFWLYSGATNTGTWLHAYGYGMTNYDGSGGGTLRTGPNGASFAISSQTAGYFEGKANSVRTCRGDSGGPVLVESSDPAVRPIVWGTIEGENGNRINCTGKGDTMLFTKTTTNIGFYESVIGASCHAPSGNPPGSPVQCW